MTRQQRKDLTRAATLIGEVYGCLHQVDEQEAHRLIQALDIMEQMLTPVKTARAIPVGISR